MTKTDFQVLQRVCLYIILLNSKEGIIPELCKLCVVVQLFSLLVTAACCDIFNKQSSSASN